MKKYFCRSCQMYLKPTEVTYGELCEYCDKPVILKRYYDWMFWFAAIGAVIFYGMLFSGRLW